MRNAIVIVAAILAGCVDAPAPRPTASAQAPQAAWVEVGPQGHASVRAVVAAGGGCPGIVVDSVPLPMHLRAAASRPAMRPTATAMEGGKPALFDVDVCEEGLPEGAIRISVDGQPLPVPRAEPLRIVVIGDTGCRIKGKDAQDCNSPASWPFLRVATGAAALAPDLVIHVGDYHYRETPCPANHPGCVDSPWGYGWDVWHTDFFTPAAPLMAAAPWVFVRGNHEECARAGQGWFRFLAPERYDANRSCDLAVNDDDADFSPPYAVPLGGGLQLVIFDSARAGSDPLDPSRARDAVTLSRYREEVAQLDAFAAAAPTRTWFLSHHPVLGFAPDYRHPAGAPLPGNAALQQALSEANGPAYFPAGVEFALHGHVHLFQAISFASSHPATLVAGNGGDGLDTDLPSTMPAGLSPAPGATTSQITHAGTFGYMLLERTGASSRLWHLHAYRSDGSVLTECTIEAGKLACTPEGSLH